MKKEQAIDLAKKVIEIETQSLSLMSQRLNEDFFHAVNVVKEALDTRGKIVVVGVGKSGNIGHKIAATLNSTGATSVVLNSQNALHGDLGILNDGDVVIALSYSGETPELIQLLPHIKRFQVKIIAITGKRDSTLHKNADIMLDTSVEREACPLNLAPTSSSTNMLVMGDALAMVLLESRGFTESDFARFHPGGSLGKSLLTKVKDIMRSGDALATVGENATVSDALVAMNHARAGACVIVDATGFLAGVFTHGDFVRAFTKNPNIADKLVTDFATKKPITIAADALAVSAINAIGSHRIDDVVVLDENHKPVGLVDTQDLARLR